MGMMGGEGDGGEVRCDLCGAAAEVHCEADAAFLCAGCDAKVHGANFLASRHRRSRVERVREEEDGASASESESESESSCCVSTADSATAALEGRKRRSRKMRTPKRSRAGRGEAVLEGWAKRMGLQAGAARRRAAAAGRALRARGRDVAAAGVPLRVAMAAALWWEVAEAGKGASVVVRRTDTLQRLEACAHVPARVVVAVASSMGRARATGPPAAVQAEEGWDECS